MNVGLFIKDFELGTRVSTKLTELESTFEFCEKSTDLSKKTKLVIIDLDNEDMGNEFFIHQMATNRKDIQIVGAQDPLCFFWQNLRCLIFCQFFFLPIFPTYIVDYLES